MGDRMIGMRACSHRLSSGRRWAGDGRFAAGDAWSATHSVAHPMFGGGGGGLKINDAVTVSNGMAGTGGERAWCCRPTALRSALSFLQTRRTLPGAVAPRITTRCRRQLHLAATTLHCYHAPLCCCHAPYSAVIFRRCCDRRACLLFIPLPLPWSLRDGGPDGRLGVSWWCRFLVACGVCLHLCLRCGRATLEQFDLGGRCAVRLFQAAGGCRGFS